MPLASRYDQRMQGLGSDREKVYGIPLFTAQDAMTALAGGGQANATPITTVVARFTTVATANDSALLPQAVPGLCIVLANAGAASMNVFPYTGDAVNALGANNAYAVASGKNVEFFCAVAGVWHTILSA